MRRFRTSSSILDHQISLERSEVPENVLEPLMIFWSPKNIFGPLKIFSDFPKYFVELQKSFWYFIFYLRDTPNYVMPHTVTIYIVPLIILINHTFFNLENLILRYRCLEPLWILGSRMGWWRWYYPACVTETEMEWNSAFRQGRPSGKSVWNKS